MLEDDDLDQVPQTLSGDPIVEEARKRYNRASEWEANFRRRFVNDIKFRHGDAENGYQWPNMIKRSRDVEQRPCLTVNLIRQHNLMISNQAKQNKSSVKVVALGNGATQESANVFKGLIRHTEYISNAQSAYSTALDFAIDGGKGWWRLVTDYCDNESDDQEAYIRRVRDPLAVYADPDAIEKDKSDMRWLVYFDLIPTSDFFEVYPSKKGLNTRAPLGIGSMENDSWGIPGHMMICEYFRKVEREDTLVRFVDPATGTRKAILKSKLPKALIKTILKDPLTTSRIVKETRIEWYLIAGEEVVDKTEWAGKYIPFVPVIGEETIIDGQYDCKGHTRNMSDAQRMYNYNAALAINTRIPIPSGWTTMGQLKAGDLVFDHTGKAVPVAEALPIRINEKCFKITFDNGYEVVTDAGHIWKVEERGNRIAGGFEWKDKTISTGELEPKKHFVKTQQGLALDDIGLPIDPYLLGLWLGDGHSAGGRISSNEDDALEEKAILSELGWQTSVNHNLHGKGVDFTVLGLCTKLREESLLNNKHVPRIYHRASRDQRLALLQGLMDSDGHFAKATHQCIFVNTDEQLIKDVLELCASLGLKTKVSIQPRHIIRSANGKDYIGKESFRLAFTVDPDVPIFKLSRKLNAQTKNRKVHWRRTKRLGIVSVEAVPSVPVRCIKLDTPEHLFLCGDGMIPTHNSAQVEFVALQSKTPWIASARSIENFESMWNTANLENHSVLVYSDVDDENPDVKIERPTRQDPPSASPAYQAGMETAFNQIMMSSGQWQNQMGMMGNERTGEAIKQRQQQSDTSVFHFQDNYESALRLTGKMLLDLYPRIMDTKRIRRVLADDGTDEEIEIDPTAQQAFVQMVNHRGDVIRRVFNPQVGKYDVAADVGPAYGTKREETVQALTVILTQNPGLTGIIGDLLLEAMDFDKAQEAARRMKRMVPPVALGKGPTVTEQQQQQQIQQLTAALGKSLEAHGKDKLRLTGKSEARDIEAYNAQTDRFKALSDSLGLDMGGVKAVIEQLVNDTLKDTLSPVVKANKDEIGTESGSPVASPPQMPEEPAPLPGARKAPDGQWYLTDPQRKGKYLRIAPLAQERTPSQTAPAPR